MDGGICMDSLVFVRDSLHLDEINPTRSRLVRFWPMMVIEVVAAGYRRVFVPQQRMHHAARREVFLKNEKAQNRMDRHTFPRSG